VNTASHKAFIGRRRTATVNRRHVAVGATIAAVVVLGSALSPDWAIGLLEWLAADPVRFAGALLVVAAVRPFLAWPTTLVAVAVGFGYGWAGVPFGVLLLTLTALPPYFLSRVGRRSFAGGKGGDGVTNDGESGDDESGDDEPAGGDVGTSDNRVLEAGERFVGVAGGARTVAATRLFPLPSDAVSIAAGAANVRLGPFLLGTAAGELPWVIAGVAIGVSTDRLVAGDLSVLDPTLFAGMAGVGVLLLAGPFYRAYRRGSPSVA